MRVIIIVPRRRDGGHRDNLWEVCKLRWETFFPDWQIYEGHHEASEGPFNRSKAVNRAAASAGDWDIAVSIDADIMLPVSSAKKAVATARKTGRVTWGHRQWVGLKPEALVEAMTNLAWDPELSFAEQFVERVNPISWSCFWAVPRKVWDATGGMDERFEGWGFEDMAWQCLIAGVYGHERVEGPVFHLWHERSDERLTNGRMSASREYTVNCRLGRRYMVALRRDHALHDRSDMPSSEEERARDVGNLKRDDASLEPLVRKYHLPDWTHWWPTLLELQEQAKLHIMGPPPGVTVVMRSGGRAEAWPERKQYLRRAFASFNEHVKGPFVQKVLFSDWDHEFHEELNAIAVEAGFYVVGMNKNVGYTAATQACWSYLGRRAVGDYIMSIEDDFTYSRDVDVTDLIKMLQRDPDMQQIALLRDAYYPKETEAGGVLPTLKGWQEQRDGYVAQRDHFTANPSLFRKALTSQPWPSGKSSERLFGDRVLRDGKAFFAYLGDGTPWIEHIGAVRAGSGY